MYQQPHQHPQMAPPYRPQGQPGNVDEGDAEAEHEYGGNG